MVNIAGKIAFESEFIDVVLDTAQGRAIVHLKGDKWDSARGDNGVTLFVNGEPHEVVIEEPASQKNVFGSGLNFVKAPEP